MFDGGVNWTMMISSCLPGGKAFLCGEADTPLARLLASYRTVLSLGFDCGEAGVSMIAALTDDDIAFLKAEHEAGRFSLCSCNGFIPPDMPIITDDEEAIARLFAYTERVISRMAAIGVPYVVFGSGGARRIPDGMEPDRAISYIDRFLVFCNQCCETYGMTVVIEPLNRAECNFCNTVSEGAAIVRRLQLPHIRLLADSYHMAREGEPLSVISDNRDILLHCHISSEERKVPGSTAYENEFMAALRAIGYDGAVSVECGYSDFLSESARASAYLRGQLA